MKNAPIALMDSGSGGLSVWQSVTSLLPIESTIYLGDHAHLPYSSKSEQYIRGRVVAIIRHFSRLGVKLVVIACNTATVAGISYYRKEFPTLPIIGIVPVVKTASERTKTGAFAVLSTQFTARSRYQKDLLDAFAKNRTVYNVGCPNLVTLIEQGITSGSQVRKELRDTLKELAHTRIDIIALGCTHYPFLRAEIQRIAGSSVTLLDSGAAVARHVARVLDQNDTRRTTGLPTHAFLTTGDAALVTTVARHLTGRDVTFVHEDI